MVKYIILILFIYSCVSLKTQERNKLSDIVELRLDLPDKGQINDTLEIEVVIINKGKEMVSFYEPGYIAMMEEHTDIFIMEMPIDLFVKQSNYPPKQLTLQGLDSLKYYFKIQIDSTNFRLGKMAFRITFSTVCPKRKIRDPSVYLGGIISNVDTIEIVSR